MDIETALAFAVDTNNQCDEIEHRFWYKAITEMVPDLVAGDVIEVGCMVGGGSTTLAAACDEGGFDLHCVDTWFTGAVDYQAGTWVTDAVDYRPGTWVAGAGDYQPGVDGYSALIAHIDQLRRAGLNRLVTRHIGDSKKIGCQLNVPCVFLWIDAEHGHPHPALDFLAFKDLVVPGGIVAFHDAPYHGLPESLQMLENDDEFNGWEELKDLPPADCIVPDDQKRFSISVGFCSRAWRRL